MDELRWFLLILGLLVIVAIYVYGRLQDWRHDGPPWRRRSRRPDREPFAEQDLSQEEVEGELTELDSLIAEQRAEETARPIAQPAPTTTVSPPADEPLAQETAATDEPTPAVPGGPTAAEAEVPEAAPESGREPAAGSRWRRALAGDEDRAPQPQKPQDEDSAGEQKIVIINVMAPPDTVFAGLPLVAALQALGLRHGEHGIFHRMIETRSGPVALFSVANIVKPGWFDLENAESFETPGVAFFLQLPGPFDGLSAFEQMLGGAREVADQLGGHVLDSRRCDLTHQSIEHIREGLLEYRRRAHLAARQAR